MKLEERLKKMNEKNEVRRIKKKKLVYLKCEQEKCQNYRWAPKPNMWKNHKNKGDRLIKCPLCTHPMIVPLKVVNQILKNNC
jgi:hypothetical protein